MDTQCVQPEEVADVTTLRIGHQVIAVVRDEQFRELMNGHPVEIEVSGHAFVHIEQACWWISTMSNSAKGVCISLLSSGWGELHQAISGFVRGSLVSIFPIDPETDEGAPRKVRIQLK